MVYLSLFLVVQAYSLEIACNLHECPPSIQGDGNCDLNCMNPSCNYDSGSIYQGWNDKIKSDCYTTCINLGLCWPFTTNPQCTSTTCNVHMCGYNFGFCEYCDPACTKYLGYFLNEDGNYYCNEWCNSTSCFFNPWQCEPCYSLGCNYFNWGDGICDEECNNPECKFDNFDCINSTCAPNCNTWMVNNTICDEACYVEECNFDGADCDCAPGCFDSLLKNQVCDEACNNKACNFDDGHCGYCASGCFLEMLYNDVCDDVCDNYDCKYDYYTCGCTNNCRAEDYGNCKPECLIAECKWDQISFNSSKRCNDRDLFLFTLYSQAANNDFSLTVDFNDCLLESNFTCTLEGALKCYPECFLYKCNWGLCYTDGWWCYHPSVFLCYTCWEINVLCSYASDYHYYSKAEVLGMRIEYTSSYKASDFYIYHVTSTQKDYFPSGDGSVNSPFETLDYALQSIGNMSINLLVLFLANDGNYTLSDCSPLHSVKRSTFTTYDENKVRIKTNGWQMASCSITVSAKFENIIFDGSEQYITCDDSEYCEYCSYNTYNDTDGYYYNDRGQPISQNLPANYCKSSETTDLSLFKLQNSDLILRNVNIQNLRFNYDSIIAGSGTLKLFNVNFDNIRLKGQEQNAIIKSTGLDILYLNGSVTKLNNGYELGDSFDFRGFLYSANSLSIVIKHVDFKYNLVYLKPQSSLSSASLIYISMMQNIEIENCTFMYNYFQNGLLYSKIDITNYGNSRNESSFLTYLAIEHIYIHDAIFTSNYGNMGLIHVEFLGKLLNIHLQNLTFESNAAENDSLIFITNPKIVDEYKTQTTSSISMPNSNRVTVILSPRWCKMTNITFKNNHAQAIITTNNLVNFDLKGLIIDSNGSSEDDKNINNLLLDYFIENRDIENLYISKRKNNPSAIDCDYMVSLSNSYNLDTTSFTMINNTCRKSSPTYIVHNSKVPDLASINCSGNSGKGTLPVCFYFTGNYDRNIKNSIFIGNKNYHSSGNGVIKVESENDLYIANSSFIENSANFAPSISFSGKNIYINSSNFETNESKLGSGGAIYFVLNSANDKGSLLITSSNFINNSVQMNGGGIYIETKSTAPFGMDLIVSETNFTGNYANYGSALYLDHSVSLSLDSTIISSKFNENYSKISGAIALYYYSGILSFKSCEFIENSSTFGAVFHIDITDDSSELHSKVMIELSTFRNNAGSSIINADNQNRNSTIESKNCLFEYNYGTAVSLNFDYFSDYGSIFQHNSASFGSCFFLHNSAILYASSQFLNNTSEKYGGVISISFKSVFNCDICTFIQNKAANGKGGVLDVEQESQFFISNSKFLENSCGKDGSAISVFNCNTTTSYVQNTQFENNYAEGSGLITLVSSKISLASSSINGNSAKGYASGIKLTFSIAEINDLIFENQEGISGSFLYLVSQSSINIQNTTFYKGRSSEIGGAIFLSSSALIINSSDFTQMSSPKGSAIYATFESTIHIIKSKFDDLNSDFAGGIIYADQSDLYIENSIFSHFSLSGIYGTQLKSLNIKGSTFSNGTGVNGGAIFCDSCIIITIESSVFNSNSASIYGGALFFTTSDEIDNAYDIFECKFDSNIAQNGGAIWASNAGINISLSEFEKNKAISNKSYKTEYGNGGGVRISCPDTKICNFVIQNTRFTENTATCNGGAISWDDKLPELSNNYYQDNIAEYGQDIASYPIKLMQVKEDGSLSDYKRRNLDAPASDYNTSEVASGQNIKKPLLIALVDNINNIIRTDNSSEASLRAVNSSTQISGTIKVTAINGIFNFSKFIISEEPGSSIQIMVFSSAIDVDKIKKSGENFYSQNLALDIKLRECNIGEVKSGKNCEVCPEGFYSLNPNLISCLACPDTAVCYGNYTMAPKPEYWRDNKFTDKFWKCPHPQACLGSPDNNNISYTGECGIAYTGNKCQSCKIGYSHTSNNKCEKCPSTLNNILILLGITLCLIILSFIIVKTTRKSAFKSKSHVSIYIKILLNYIQTVILASSFKLNWSSQVASLFKVQNNADYIYQQIYSFQCIFEYEDSISVIYFRTLTIIALIPFLMVFLALLFWYLIKIIKSSYKTFRDDFISTCIILLFLIHPSIVKKMFASMNCTEINSGEYWLEEDLDIRCWNYDHIFYILTLSLPTIILWGIILPTICLINIIRNRKKLDNIDIRLTYGFLFNGFKTEHFYWEFIILYSKIILICCSVFLTKISLKLQALIVAILYSIYLRLQYSNNPYTEHQLNQMELRSKLVCVITIYSGLYYLMGSLNDEASLFFYVIIIIANLYFLLYWVFHLLKSIFTSVKTNIQSWKSKSRIRIRSEIELNSQNKSYLEDQRFHNISSSIASNENLIIESQAFELSKDRIIQEIEKPEEKSNN